MAAVRTSRTHPLQAAAVCANPTHPGRIGITFCPGKHDLGIDLDAVDAWGAKLVLTLEEPTEHTVLKVPHLGQEIQSRGIDWRHLPIADYLSFRCCAV